SRGLRSANSYCATVWRLSRTSLRRTLLPSPAKKLTEHLLSRCARRTPRQTRLFRRALSPAKPPLDIILDDVLEFGGDAFAAQGHRLLAVDKHGCRRRLAGARQRDPDVGMFRFAGSVDDTAHHRDSQRFDTGIAGLPKRHLIADIGLNIPRELLKNSRCRAAAAWAGGNQRHESAKPHGLQKLLRHLHFERAVAARLGGERNSNRVADPFLYQNAHGGGRGDNALR